jgi:hypothetical protein
LLGSAAAKDRLFLVGGYSERLAQAHTATTDNEYSAIVTAIAARVSLNGMALLLDCCEGVIRFRLRTQGRKKRG